MDFQSHFSDDSTQNSDTKFYHMKKIIHWMYENKLFINNGIIYDTTYGCRKQYMCVNVNMDNIHIEFSHMYCFLHPYVVSYIIPLFMNNLFSSTGCM